MRLRVYSKNTPASRFWVFWLFDPTAPTGMQHQHSGVRWTWQEAIQDGLAALHRQMRRAA